MRKVSTSIEGPGQVASRALVEFRTWTATVLSLPSDQYTEFRITKIEWCPDRQWSVVRYAGLPKEPQLEMTLKAIGRMVAVRSRRRDHTTGELLPLNGNWRQSIKKAFAPMYDRAGSLEVGDGWFDLILAMSDLIWTIDDPAGRMQFSDIKSKYAELRAEHFSCEYNERIIDAFETISPHVCETCGAPGKIQGRGWLTAACDQHAPAEKAE